eukprot:1529546-Lingulodinium_polyedra.AAC.1
MQPLALEGEPLFRGGPRLFRQQWDEALYFFGIPSCSSVGLTPASMRAGGATWFWQASGDFEATRWRGRWLTGRTLEIYLQETAAVTLLP